MALGPDKRFSLNTGARAERMPGPQAHAAGIDAGLRAYMLKVYNYMCIGLALTGAVAFATSTSPVMLQAIYGTPLQWLVMVAPIGMVFFLAARVHAMKASTAQAVFWVDAAMIGLSLAYIFIAYTGESVTRVFFITAGAFAGLSLFGYTTKKDLTSWGSFLFMGLIGIIIASLVNIFMQSPMMHMIITYAGVLIFVGLTAYDTQKIKEMNILGNEGTDEDTKEAIRGALTLYLDFINLFLMLLRLMGDRR